jgi:Na+/H+-dicarboxylate symporter
MRLRFHWQLITGMATGALAGYVWRTAPAAFGTDVLSFFELLGTLFVNALKMLAVPLVVSSIISRVSEAGSGRILGRLGLKTLLFYVLTTVAALVVAVTILTLVKPGLVHGIPASERLGLHTPGAEVAGYFADRTVSVADTLKKIAPPNLFEAAREDNLLGLVFFSVLVGYALSRVGSEHGQVVSGFFAGLCAATMQVTGLVMRLAPLGVFGLVARTVAISGLSAAGPLLVFSVTVVAGLLLYSIALLPLLVRLAARVSPRGLFAAMAPALLTAFSTASSAAALASSIDCVQRRVGVSPRVAGFVMSLGASLNHAGTALYECAAVLFVAQAYGIHLSFVQRCTVAGMALGTSMGMAGIPAASLMAIGLMLGALGLPAEALGTLLVFDRLLDMCRTAVNVFADACCAVIVAKLEGETLANGPTADVDLDATHPVWSAH